MTTQINTQARAELVRALRSRYQDGIHGEKNRILTEFVADKEHHSATEYEVRLRIPVLSWESRIGSLVEAVNAATGT